MSSSRFARGSTVLLMTVLAVGCSSDSSVDVSAGHADDSASPVDEQNPAHHNDDAAAGEMPSLEDSLRDEAGRIISVISGSRDSAAISTEEDLYRASSDIVVAVAEEPRYVEDEFGFVLTIQPFVTEETFKGDLPDGSHFVVQHVGGETAQLMGNPGSREFGPFFVVDYESPPFRTGERYMLFISSEPTADLADPYARTLAGAGVGQYRIVDDRLAGVAALAENPVVQALQGREYREVARAAANANE